MLRGIKKDEERKQEVAGKRPAGRSRLKEGT